MHDEHPFFDWCEEHGIPPKRGENWVECLDRCNGTRQIRRVEHWQVVRALEQLVEDGDKAFLAGGNVANSYPGNARQTVVCLFRHEGFLLGLIREASAGRGATGFGDVLRGDQWIGGRIPLHLAMPMEEL